MAAVTICSDFGAPKNKVCYCFVSPCICREVMGPDAMILVFWLFSSPWTATHQAFLSIPNSRSLSKLVSIESVMHPTISSSVVPFFPCPQSFPASESFQMSQLFASGGQSIRVSASTSVLPMNTQDWCPLGWTVWISFQSKGLSRVFSNITVQKHQFFGTQLSL